MLPSSLPCTTTPLASTLALTWPLGPTVRLFPLRAMLPSTWPSRYRSSLPESSPLMKTDLPICANPVAGALIGRSPGATASVTVCSQIRIHEAKTGLHALQRLYARHGGCGKFRKRCTSTRKPAKCPKLSCYTRGVLEKITRSKLIRVAILLGVLLAGIDVASLDAGAPSKLLLDG